MTTRNRLANRRPCARYEFDHGGFKYHAIIGFDPKSGSPTYVFRQTGKPGTEIVAVARDAAVLASLSLQYGLPVAPTQLDDGKAAGPIAALLDRYVREASA